MSVKILKNQWGNYHEAGGVAAPGAQQKRALTKV